MPTLLVAVCLLGGCSSDRGTAPPNVTISTDLSQTFDCEARDCLAAYRNFPAEHVPFARPRDEATLRAELEELDHRPLPGVLGIRHEEVREAIVDALNIDFMLDGLDPRELHVTIFDEKPGPDFTTRRLIFADPLVGELEALALEPPGDQPVPAIIGLHGHFDTPQVFADQYMGAELAASGYFVIVPQLRAMNCFGPEAEISWSLLRSGFTLMGMRVYETLLVLKYLRRLERVEPTRIGLLTHSGGSSTGNLAVQLTRGITAQVTDYVVDWRDHCTEFDFASLHCETLPALFPLGATLGDEAYAPVPRLIVPYAFEDDATRAEIRTFLDRQLRDRR